MGVEWSGREQVYFFFQGVLAGVCIGFLFDVFTGWGRAYRSALRVFVLDVVFGLLAAWFTFCASLVIMDGQLHPLLFLAMGLGMVSEHACIGRWVSRGVCGAVKLCGWLRKQMCMLIAGVMGYIRHVITRFAVTKRRKSENIEKNTNLR